MEPVWMDRLYDVVKLAIQEGARPKEFRKEAAEAWAHVLEERLRNEPSELDPER